VFQALMKTLRLASVVALAIAAAALLSGCVFIDSASPAVSVHTARQSISSGEVVELQADTLDPRGGGLSYEWSEDSVVLDASGPSLAYSRFVAVPSTVSLRVKVTDSFGASASSTVEISVVPPSNPGTITVRNLSPYPVYYLHVSKVGTSDWGPDQLRPDTIVLHDQSFTLRGVASGSWDVKALGSGGAPQWQNTLNVLPGQTVVLDLY
jgi:hypothetical protein